MEIELVHKLLEFELPFLNLLRVLTVKLLRFEVGTDKFYPCRSAKYLFLGLVLWPNNLEDCIKGNHKAFFVDFVLGLIIEDSFGGEDERYWWRKVRLEVKGAA